MVRRWSLTAHVLILYFPRGSVQGWVSRPKPAPRRPQMLVGVDAAAGRADRDTTHREIESAAAAVDDFALLRWVCMVSPAALAAVVTRSAVPPLSPAQVWATPG